MRLRPMCAACFVWLIVAGGGIHFATAVRGQDNPAIAVDDVNFEALVTSINAQSDLSEASRKQLLDSIAVAKQNQVASRDFAARAETNLRESGSALKRANELQAKLDGIQSDLPDYDSYELEKLEQEKLQLETEITELKSRPTATDENANRLQRRKLIRDRLVKVDQDLTKAKSIVDAFPKTKPDLATGIGQLESKLNWQKLANENRALRSELTKYDAEEAANLYELQQQLNQAQLEVAKSKLVKIQESIRKKQGIKTGDALQLANRQIESAHPAVQPIAVRSKQIVEQNIVIRSKLETTQRELKQAIDERDQWRIHIGTIKNKAKTIGLNSTMGEILRRERDGLPSPTLLRQAIRNRRPEIESVELSLLDLESESSVGIAIAIRKTLESHDKYMSSERATLEQEAAKLEASKRENLRDLIKNESLYLDKLYELNTTIEEIIAVTTEFSKYVEKRVLWIRSSKPLYASWTGGQQSFWFTDSRQFSELIPSLMYDIQDKPILYVIIVLLQLLLFVAGFRLERQSASIGKSVSRRAVTQFGPTGRVAIFTLLLSIPIPVLFLFVAWRMNAFAGDSQMFRGLSGGFHNLAWVLFPMEFAREMCRPNGLAEAHLKWPRASLRILQKNLKLLIILGLPLVFITTVFDISRPPRASEFLERISFILAAILLSVFLSRILHPRRGAIAAHVMKHAGGWLDRMRHVWYWTSIAIPLSLGGLAFSGYYFTAQQLAWRLYITICLIFGLVVIKALFSRWFMLQRRTLLIDQARKKREKQLQLEPKTSEPGEFQESLPNLSTDDLKQQTEQSRKLVSTVSFVVALMIIWFTWSNVLPALEYLEEWPVWKSTVTVTESSINDAGETTSIVRNKEVNVSIADVAFSILIVIVTFVAARNIPGTLGIVFLQRLPIDKSIRYAITTLASYVIVAIGLVFACSVIGLHWNQIQWIATALTFGLAFGLQEMFANFIAGIIVLFERPIRVGDVVTIGDTTGTVARIRMRATTIISFDRKDFLVPNKEFITGKLLNWTLSDQVSRLDINVGVAYGSDTKLVKKLLLEAAENHPDVLDEPAPWAMFDGFGENSLNYILRPCVGAIDKRTCVKNELHEIIEKSFREAGIAIPFPQRDINIKGSIQLPPASKPT